MRQIKVGHLHAFSMVETVVGLVVTAIIAGIVFLVFAIVSGQLSAFQKQNEEISDLNRLSYTLNEAMFKSSLLFADADSVRFADYQGNVVVFSRFDNLFLRRSEQFTDTFRLQIDSINLKNLRSPAGTKVFKRLRLVFSNKRSMNFYQKMTASELLDNPDSYGH